MLKKNRFLFFVILNTVLLIVILFLSIPISKLLKKIDLEDNEFIEGQVIINPKAVSPAILDREVNIKLLEYILKNIDRSYDKVFKFIKDIDNLSLSTGKSININLIKKVL